MCDVTNETGLKNKKKLAWANPVIQGLCGQPHKKSELK